MVWIKLPYLCRPEGPPAGFRCDFPIISIQIIRDKKVFETVGLIDSGCQRTHINHDIADFLGIDPHEGTKTNTSGITGMSEGFSTSIQMKVKDGGDVFGAPVVFVKGLPVAVLLGQENFFEKFNVRFEKSKGFFYIERV